MLSPVEQKILKKIAEFQIISQTELCRKMEPENLHNLVDGVVKSLLQMDYITTVSPIGKKCLAITRSGMKAANEHI